jgi:hypothetical protein
MFLRATRLHEITKGVRVGRRKVKDGAEGLANVQRSGRSRGGGQQKMRK